MPIDDSDSELDEFTETAVLLGYPEKESKGDDISHLGGAPVSIFPCGGGDIFQAHCRRRPVCRRKEWTGQTNEHLWIVDMAP